MVYLVIDDHLLLYDQIDVNLLLLPVEVLGARLAIQYFVVGVSED